MVLTSRSGSTFISTPFWAVGHLTNISSEVSRPKKRKKTQDKWPFFSSFDPQFRCTMILHGSKKQLSWMFLFFFASQPHVIFASGQLPMVSWQLVSLVQINFVLGETYHFSLLHSHSLTQITISINFGQLNIMKVSYNGGTRISGNLHMYIYI